MELEFCKSAVPVTPALCLVLIIPKMDLFSVPSVAKGRQEMALVWRSRGHLLCYWDLEVLSAFLF